MAEAGQKGWVAVARLLRPQGRRGELLAEPLTDLPRVLEAGSSLRLVAEGAAEPGPSDREVAIKETWEPTGRNAGRVVLKLGGCDDISAAEALAGKQLMMPAESLPPLEEDRFYVRDLLGCKLLDGGVEVGEIVDVQFATTPDGKQRLDEAAPLLEVVPAGASAEDTVLVPFVRAYLVRVDVPARRVEMNLPPGLIENGAEADGLH